MTDRPQIVARLGRKPLVRPICRESSALGADNGQLEPSYGNYPAETGINSTAHLDREHGRRTDYQKPVAVCPGSLGARSAARPDIVALSSYLYPEGHRNARNNPLLALQVTAHISDYMQHGNSVGYNVERSCNHIWGIGLHRFSAERASPPRRTSPRYVFHSWPDALRCGHVPQAMQSALHGCMAPIRFSAHGPFPHVCGPYRAVRAQPSITPWSARFQRTASGPFRPQNFGGAAQPAAPCAS